MKRNNQTFREIKMSKEQFTARAETLVNSSSVANIRNALQSAYREGFNESVYENIDLIEGWKIIHPTSHDAHQQNIVVNEIIEAVKKLLNVQGDENAPY